MKNKIDIFGYILGALFIIIGTIQLFVSVNILMSISGFLVFLNGVLIFVVVERYCLKEDEPYIDYY